MDSSFDLVRRCPTDFLYLLEVHASNSLGIAGVRNGETGGQDLGLNENKSRIENSEPV